jgi:putative transposase
VDSSFERFCLTAGIGAIEQMLCEDAQQLAGAPHSRGGGRVGHRWGGTKGKIGFHGGKVAVRLPEGGLPAITGDGTSKSAASRRFVALSAKRLAEWMASDLSPFLKKHW